MQRRTLMIIAILGFMSLPILAQESEPRGSVLSAPDKRQTEASSEIENEGTVTPRHKFGLGHKVGDPTALYGPSRRPVVNHESDRRLPADLGLYYKYQPNETHSLLLATMLAPDRLGVDLGYRIAPEDWEGALTTNLWVSTGTLSAFRDDDFEVHLPGRQNPYLQMFGAGVEYHHPFSDKLEAAVGLNYVQYAFSDELFSGTRQPFTDGGFPLTVNGTDPRERFLSLKFHGVYDNLDDAHVPRAGTKIRFGLEQALELGSSSTSFTKAELNVGTLFSGQGFGDKQQTLMLNFQGGAIMGDPPSISAFHIGGPNSNRGYRAGEFASGKAFVQTTVEYRHDLREFQAFGRDINARLALFHDYTSVLGTEDQLAGLPPSLSLKPTDGSSFGAGLHFEGDFGVYKLETAWNQEGDNNIFVSIGERF